MALEGVASFIINPNRYYSCIIDQFTVFFCVKCIKGFVLGKS